MIFNLNPDFLITSYHIEEYTDHQLIVRQLFDAPLLENLLASEIYQKRSDLMKPLTAGADVIESKAVIMTDYILRFQEEMKRALNKLRCDPDVMGYHRLFFQNKAIIVYGLMFNRIEPENIKKYSIRSPKFSKHLVKTFGERSAIVALFNDRPRPEKLDETEHVVNNEYKVVVSLLAANVMKMSAENAFSTCQNYTYDEREDLDNLQSLPSSVNDKYMAIAYLVEESDTYEAPYMLARVLLAPHQYGDHLFYIAHNAYQDEAEHGELLIGGLKALYGKRILFTHEMYKVEGDINQNQLMYDYPLCVSFNYGEATCDCYLCEGSGEVEAEVKAFRGYTFFTDCPECEGEGSVENEDYESYSSSPYINESKYIHYRDNVKYTEVPNEILESILCAESMESGTKTA
ncbi:hypothetical protein [Brevibacillus laterosporus]|uniref:hypothetical protein n=1 Tax=Brevibacillus laterosporus TaxID=1465 RepID=UPI003D2091D2